MTDIKAVLNLASLLRANFPNGFEADYARVVTEIHRDPESYGFSLLKTYNTHDERVQAALGSAVIMDWVKAGRKINAIKEHRTITRASLKESKDAIEDKRVSYFAPKTGTTFNTY